MLVVVKKNNFICILQENFLTSNAKAKAYLAVYRMLSIMPNIPTLVMNAITRKCNFFAIYHPLLV